VGFLSICYGAASRYLGLLAATMSRWDEAEKHYREALNVNARMGARPWLAHTQHQYAIMLLARGHSEDLERANSLLEEALYAAKEMEMASLAKRIEAINLPVAN
jgi:tetratricopeptide (TPR) repeat protein